MEQVRHVQRQPNFANSSQNMSKTGVHGQAKLAEKGQHEQNKSTGGRNTVLNHHHKNDLLADPTKQRRTGATTRLQQRSQLNNFLAISNRAA